MILRSCWLLAAFLAPLALAGVEITSPEAGSTLRAGDALKVQWKDSGTSPPLDELTSYQLFLCAGGSEEGSYTILKTLIPSADFSARETGEASSTIESDLGESVDDAYFIKMISTFPGGSVVNFSDRFSISDMSGHLAADVLSALATVDRSAGSPRNPKAQEIFRRAAPAAATAGDPADFAVEYTMQTGPIRYAPMAKQPPSKITAEKNPEPAYPTTSVKLVSKNLPIPKQVNTITEPMTYSVQSAENPVAAAPNPTDTAMQKYLNRWKD